jgi:hypothetical protein
MSPLSLLWLFDPISVEDRIWGDGNGTGRAHAVSLAGPRHGFGPNAGFLNKKFFSFSNLFYKVQINLNSNQI